MEIKGPKGPDKTSKTDKSKKSGKSQSAGAAFRSFLQEGDAKIEGSQGLSGASAAAPMDAILALQGVDPDEARQNRQKAVDRGHNMLDILDELRVGILTGQISGGRLQALQNLIAEQREALDDPRLVEILDDIDLRAAIELAKLER